MSRSVIGNPTSRPSENSPIYAKATTNVDSALFCPYCFCQIAREYIQIVFCLAHYVHLLETSEKYLYNHLAPRTAVAASVQLPQHNDENNMKTIENSVVPCGASNVYRIITCILWMEDMVQASGATNLLDSGNFPTHGSRKTMKKV